MNLEREEMMNREVEISRWCQTHWNELRAAIDRHGLDHLVSPNAKSAARQIENEFRFGTRHDVEGFDPLMRAWSMISMRAMECGISPLAGCPLCVVQQHYDTCKEPGCQGVPASEWIEGCVKAGREYVKKLGLLKPEDRS